MLHWYYAKQNDGSRSLLGLVMADQQQPEPITDERVLAYLNGA